MRASYDTYHADHITEVLSGDCRIMASLSSRRVALEERFDKIAAYAIASCSEAATVLQLLLEMTAAPESGVEYRAAQNVVQFLQGHRR